MPVLLTRPEAQSRAFAEALRDRFGPELPIVESPLLEIQYVQPDVSFDGFDGLVFTSQNGVASAARLGVPTGLRAYCVGNRTAEAARAIGFSVTSASADVTALGVVIDQSAQGQSLLHMRGRHVAGKMPSQVTSVVTYEQVPLAMNKRAKDLLRDAKEVAIPLFSPRTSELFQAGLENGMGGAWHAVCISENAATPLSTDRFEAIKICAHPTAVAMIDGIAGLLSPPSA